MAWLFLAPCTLNGRKFRPSLSDSSRGHQAHCDRSGSWPLGPSGAVLWLPICGRMSRGAVATAQGQVQELRCGCAECPCARVRGRVREGRGPREPDARVWCRWRRGQSRHCTLIFDLATGRCFTARCPLRPTSPGARISRSGARGEELLSVPPGSPELLLPPPLLLPPSLRQSSGGSQDRRPKPTAEGGAEP